MGTIQTDPPAPAPAITCKCGRPMFCVKIERAGRELHYRCDRCGRRLWMVWDESRVKRQAPSAKGQGVRQEPDAA